jgi:cardiolipin synthase (CMP-forming)
MGRSFVALVPCAVRTNTMLSITAQLPVPNSDLLVVTEIGILLLWLSAILTLYTGWDYMRADLQYMVDE